MPVISALELMTYSLQTARNHFYSWAACRAAQAGSAKARRNELLDALSHSGVIEYLQQQPAQGLTADQLDALYYAWVEGVLARLRTQYGKNVSFGIAAKLISVYLKGAWVLHSNADCELAKLVHPPIDSILLEAIDAAKGTRLSREYKWQKLDRAKYEALIGILREIAGPEPLWKLEEHWRP
jgi:hypothetical protein